MLDEVFWPRLNDLFAFQILREFKMFHSPRQILVCAYTIWQYSQSFISCTIPSGSPSPLHTHLCLVLLPLLNYSAAFVYYVINRFNYVYTQPTLAILLHIINFCFYIISPNGIILSRYEQTFTFSLEISLSKSYSGFPECNLDILSLKVSIKSFSHFRFLVYVVFLFVLLLSLLLLAAPFIMSLCYLMHSSNPCIDASAQIRNAVESSSHFS